MQEKRDAQTCSSRKENTELCVSQTAAHTFTSLSCFWCSPRSWWHHCHPSAPVPVLDNEGTGQDLAGCVSHSSLPVKTCCGYELGRFSNCRAFCSSLHLWAISPPLKCFTLFITFHLTPATSSK